LETEFDDHFCPECNQGNLIHDQKTGAIICSHCGLVIEQIIDSGPEWRAFNAEEKKKKARIDRPTSITAYDKGLGSQIGNKMNYRNNSNINRLRKLNLWTKGQEKFSRNLKKAMILIDKVCSQFKLPKIINKGTALLYRKIIKKKMTKGRSIEYIVLATVYIICRKFEIPIKISELTSFFYVKEKAFWHYFRLIVEEFELHISPISISTLIKRYLNELGLSYDVEREAMDLLKICKGGQRFIGKSPSGIAGAIIYYSSIITGDNRSQAKISEVADVSETTIRNLSRLIRKYIN
jgi:transcription initiation factor TFIIB